MTRYIIFVALLSYSACCYLPSPLRAQVVISEVYPAPDTGESEWVELYNTATTSADLSGWVLWDTLTTPSILQQFTNLVLHPHQVFVVSLTGSKLNNTGDTVVLKDQSASISAQLAYPSGTKGLSWHLDFLQNTIFEASPSAGVIASASVTVPEPTPIATESTQVTIPTASASAKPNVQLSEIMACPKSGQEEWIELYNSGPTILLDNWLITDATGNTRTLSGSIGVAEFAVFSWSSSILNNSGDSLTITSNLGSVIDQASYTACQSGYSLSVSEDTWHLSEPTPNQPNKLLQVAKVATASAEPTKINPIQPVAVVATPSGAVLAATTKAPKPYPYSIQKVLIATPAPTQQTKDVLEKMTQQPPGRTSLGGILGSVLIIVSSLYARTKT